MQKITITWVIFLIITLLCPSAMALTNGTDFNKHSSAGINPAPSSQTESRRIPVSVTYKNTDELGKALALRLQEKIVSSPIFRTPLQGEKRIIIVLTSYPEFKNTSSSVRSIYSVVWTFFYKEDTLTSYLGQSLGILSLPSLSLTAEDILARTISLAQEYTYLFSGDEK